MITPVSAIITLVSATQTIETTEVKAAPINNNRPA